MTVQGKATGPRTIRGVPCTAVRVTGSYLRPFSVYVADNGPSRDAGTLYYTRYSDAGRAILRNDEGERHWLANAVEKATGVRPASFVGF